MTATVKHSEVKKSQDLIVRDKVLKSNTILQMKKEIEDGMSLISIIRNFYNSNIPRSIIKVAIKNNLTDEQFKNKMLEDLDPNNS